MSFPNAYPIQFSGTLIAANVVGETWRGPVDHSGSKYSTNVVWDIVNSVFIGEVFKSTDGGMTWTEQDASHHLNFSSSSIVFSFHYPGSGSYLYAVFTGTNGTTFPHVGGCRFNMATDLWDTPAMGPSAKYPSSNAIGIGTVALSTGVQVFTYTDLSAGVDIWVTQYDWNTATWGTPQLVSANAPQTGRSVIGLTVDPTDTVWILYQIVDNNASTSTSYHVGYASGTVGAPFHVAVLDDTDVNAVTISVGPKTISFPGVYSTNLNALLYTIFEHLAGTSSTLVIDITGPSDSLVTGPSITTDCGNPRLAYNSAQTALYLTLCQLPQMSFNTQILIWKSTDDGATWGPMTVFYDLDVNPPTPPPTIVDGWEYPSMYIAANGDIGYVVAIPLNPNFFFCGAEFFIGGPFPGPLSSEADLGATFGLTADASSHGCIIVVSGISVSCPVTISVVIGVPYSSSITASGGTGPYTYAITSGMLPPGLSLNTSTGLISGIPTTTGTYTFTVSATDSMGSPASRSCPIQVTRPCPGNQFVPGRGGNRFGNTD